MAMTPEAKVKKRVKELLRQYPDIWFTMPVPSGFGESTLDFLCAMKMKHIAAFFAVETKAPGRKPTERQGIMIERMREVGAAVFIIDGDEGLRELQVWIEQLRALRDGSRC